MLWLHMGRVYKNYLIFMILSDVCFIINIKQEFSYFAFIYNIDMNRILD